MKLIISNGDKRVFLIVYSGRASQNLYLRENYSKIFPVQRDKQAKNSELVAWSYNFDQDGYFRMASIVIPFTL